MYNYSYKHKIYIALAAPRDIIYYPIESRNFIVIKSSLCVILEHRQSPFRIQLKFVEPFQREKWQIHTHSCIYNISVKCDTYSFKRVYIFKTKT